MSRPVLAFVTSLAMLGACRDAARSGPPSANARALTAALRDVAAAPAAERAARLATTVAVACGPSCACLTAATGCAASDPSVPAGWPALEQSGRYLREQLVAVGRMPAWPRSACPLTIAAGSCACTPVTNWR